MNELIDLKDKSAIVFGGTRKIGRHISLTYAAAGAKVAIVGRDQESGDRIVAEIKQTGGTAAFFMADITEFASVQAATEKAVSEFGPIEVMCASASGRTPERQGFRPFSEIAPEEFLGYSMTHWISKMYCVKASLPSMRERGGGAVVLITSDAGRTPTVGESFIGGGAAACILMTRTLAKEFVRWKIRINTVAISVTDTGDTGQGTGMSYGVDPSFAAKMGEKLRSRQVIHVTGSHVAGAALYLASDAAAAMTGQSFSINGGISV